MEAEFVVRLQCETRACRGPFFGATRVSIFGERGVDTPLRGVLRSQGVVKKREMREKENTEERKRRKMDMPI